MILTRHLLKNQWHIQRVFLSKNCHKWVLFIVLLGGHSNLTRSVIERPAWTGLGASGRGLYSTFFLDSHMQNLCYAFWSIFWGSAKKKWNFEKKSRVPPPRSAKNDHFNHFWESSCRNMVWDILKWLGILDEEERWYFFGFYCKPLSFNTADLLILIVGAKFGVKWRKKKYGKKFHPTKFFFSKNR